MTSRGEDIGEPTAKDILWDGITQSHTLGARSARQRTDLADSAKAYNWPRVLALLSRTPELINTTRPVGHSLYAPLHQAAHGGASAEVVSQLLTLGAFRTLKEAQGKYAVDIARARSHMHLFQILEPVYSHKVPARVLQAIQANFHAVIHERAHRLVEEHKLRLPDLEPVLEFSQGKFWFAVPGMYGGFAYWLADPGPNAKLITESWCRVVGGSGQRHEITAQGSTLLAWIIH